MTKKFGIKRAEPKPGKPSTQPTATQRVTGSSEQIQARVDRKRTAVQQPRTAGMRSETAQTPRPKTKADIVADMRKQRGFAPQG
jgi:hypothetical protein